MITNKKKDKYTVLYKAIFYLKGSFCPLNVQEFPFHKSFQVETSLTQSTSRILLTKSVL